MGDINLKATHLEKLNLKTLFQRIVFQINTGYCRDIFVRLVGYLEKLETLNYPYHYENLEFRQEQYRKAEEEIKKFKENIKVDRDVYNARDFIEDKVEKKRAEPNTFTGLSRKKVERQISIIMKNANINDRIKRTQVSNLKSEFMKYMKCPLLRYVDIFQKHEDFCLHLIVLSADKIREIRRTIKSKMSIDVSYTNVFDARSQKRTWYLVQNICLLYTT